MTTKSLYTGLAIRAAGDEPEITITTPARDLMRDTLDPLGMDVTSYLNGTRAVNFAHLHDRLPVGKTLSLARSAQGIRARFRWSEANPEARIVRGVFEEGVLGASVEFVPVEKEPNRDGGTHYARSILSGWALTSNPANPQCVRMVKSLGLWREPASDDVVLVLDDGPDLGRRTKEGKMGTILNPVQLRIAFDLLSGVPGAAPARQKLAEALCEAHGQEIARLQQRREAAGREADAERILAGILERIAWSRPHGAGSVTRFTRHGHPILLPMPAGGQPAPWL